MHAHDIEPAPAVRTKRGIVLIACGFVLFGIGLVGVAIPVLPTTIFWIGAAACFAKSSPRMYQRIMGWPGVGPVVEDFLCHGVIARRSKTFALFGMAVAAALVVLAPLGDIVMAGTLAVILLAAIYVVTRPERAGLPAGE